jgi:hypothetical protein
MKKPIILLAAITVTAFNLFAQHDKAINAKVSEQFNEAFPGARRVTWTSMENKISKVHFVQDGQIRLAFFDSKGSLIASGRKLKSIESLPMQIRASLEQKKARLEKKHGPLVLAYTYEMITGGTTKYYSTLGNAQLVAVLSVAPDGSCTVERKDRRPEVQTIEQAPPDIIAKKN